MQHQGERRREVDAGTTRKLLKAKIINSVGAVQSFDQCSMYDAQQVPFQSCAAEQFESHHVTCFK